MACDQKMTRKHLNKKWNIFSAREFSCRHDTATGLPLFRPREHRELRIIKKFFSQIPRQMLQTIKYDEFWYGDVLRCCCNLDSSRKWLRLPAIQPPPSSVTSMSSLVNYYGLNEGKNWKNCAMIEEGKNWKVEKSKKVKTQMKRVENLFFANRKNMFNDFFISFTTTHFKIAKEKKN